MSLYIVAIGWIAFRATSLNQLSYLFTHLQYATSDMSLHLMVKLALLTLALIIVQVFQLIYKTPVFFVKINPWLKGVSYAAIICSILLLVQHDITRFIYQGF